MIRLGEIQDLTVVKRVDFGVYLADEETDVREKVLLPIRQVPEGTKTGDRLRVFIYRDSRDRMIATANQPGITLGQVGLLRVSQVGKIGAFLDWGLEKELLLPFREQTRRVKEGEECLAALYIDKSDRLCATMKLYPYLKKDGSFQKDDRVQGRVYEISSNFGAFVAVEDTYSGLIPMKEMYGQVAVGAGGHAKGHMGVLHRLAPRVVYIRPDHPARVRLPDRAAQCQGLKHRPGQGVPLCAQLAGRLGAKLRPGVRAAVQAVLVLALLACSTVWLLNGSFQSFVYFQF